METPADIIARIIELSLAMARSRDIEDNYGGQFFTPKAIAESDRERTKQEAELAALKERLNEMLRYS